METERLHYGFALVVGRSAAPSYCYRCALGGLVEDLSTQRATVMAGRSHGLEGQLGQDREQVQRAARVEQVRDVVEQVAEHLAVAGLCQELRLDVARGHDQAEQVRIDRRRRAIR